MTPPITAPLVTAPLVDASGVVKLLGRGRAQIEALKSVDLSLPGGELTLLMGPSGSGKTTLLSILGCLMRPTSGSVRICGTATEGADAERLAEIRRRHIGFIFQSYHLFRTMTAAENVQLALDVRGERGRKARRRAHELLVRVGMGDKLRSYPKELSGGEQQRVAIARAVVAEPEIVLADEPTAALDGSTGQAIMQILATIAKEQHRAVLVVTHDSRLTRFADRIISIEDGRIDAQDRPNSKIYQMRGV